MASFCLWLKYSCTVSCQWKLSEVQIYEFKNELQKPLPKSDLFPNYQDTLKCIPLISKVCEWSKFLVS